MLCLCQNQSSTRGIVYRIDLCDYVYGWSNNGYRICENIFLNQIQEGFEREQFAYVMDKVIGLIKE